LDRGSLGVNVANGTLVFQQDDLDIAGTTLNLGISHYYNSLSSRNTSLGTGWSMAAGGDVKLEELSSGDVRFFGPSGYVVRFKKNGSAYDTPTGLDASLTKNGDGSGWKLKLLPSQERYAFDSQGRMSADVNEKSDQKINYSYATGKIDKITDTQGRVVQFNYWIDDPSTTADDAYVGQLKSIRDATGRGWDYAYDGSGRLSSVTLVRPQSDNGLTPFTRITYLYNAQGRLREIDDPNGVATKIGYAGDTGRVASVTRSSAGEPSDVGADGYITSFEYNADTSKCDSSPDQKATIVTAPNGNETPLDPTDFRTTYCHDDKSRVKRVIDALGHKQDQSWSSQSNVVSYTSGIGATSTFDFNSTTDRLQNITSAGGAAVDLSYSGAATTSFNPTSLTTRVDGASASPRSTFSFGYSGAGNTGNLTTITNTAISPDPLVKLEYFDQSAPNPDWQGLLKSSTDGRGTGTSDPDDYKTTYDYDPQGNLTTVTPPKSLSGVQLQGPTLYEYDSLSRIKAVTDGKGTKRTIEYDALDRPTGIRYPAQHTDGDSVLLTYDPDGNVIERDDGRQDEGRATEKDQYQYDERNLRVDDLLRSARHVTYEYDANGNLSTLNYQTPNAGITKYEYNQVNLVTKITEPPYPGRSQPAPFTFAYNDDNQLNELDFPNGVVQKDAYAQVNQKETGILRSIKAWSAGRDPGTTSPDLLSLTYDFNTDYQPSNTSTATALIQRVTDDVTNTTTIYDYDALGRLTTSSNSGGFTKDYVYEYNKASGLTKITAGGASTTYGINTVNEITTINGQAAGSYDDEGNLLSLGGQSYRYDQRNRTRGITPSGQSEVPFDYADHTQSERLLKGPTEYLDTVLGATAEFPPSQSTFYTRTPSGQPLDIRSSSGDNYYLSDARGSVTVATTAGGQSAAARYRYTPYGATESVARTRQPTRSGSRASISTRKLVSTTWAAGTTTPRSGGGPRKIH
jgi:YD repeat-containing protein